MLRLLPVVCPQADDVREALDNRGDDAVVRESGRDFLACGAVFRRGPGQQHAQGAARAGSFSPQRRAARARSVVQVRSRTLTRPATASSVLRAALTPSRSSASAPDSSACRHRQ
jgi:hypothetical protein